MAERTRTDTAESTASILTLLTRSHPREPDTTSQLRSQAIEIIRASSHNDSAKEISAKSVITTKSTSSSQIDSDSSPSTIHELLTHIIKPLFSPLKHHALTVSGRVAQVPQSAIPGRFNQPYNLFDEESEARAKPWKALVASPGSRQKPNWPVSLLSHILQSYTHHPAQILNSHIHLLTPPILLLIDDSSSRSKSQGCQLLYLLAKAACTVRSDILAKTGLVDVFVDALRPNFMLLPTLTPEDESLEVLQELYPAFLMLVDAATTSWKSDVQMPPLASEESTLDTLPIQSTLTPPQSDPFPFLLLGSIEKPKPSSLSLNAKTLPQKRYALLTLLLRHALLPSLSHLQITPTASTGSISTTSLPLTIFLLTQIPLIARSMGLPFVVHLQIIIPLLGNLIKDPFSLYATDMMIQAMKSLQIVTEICAERIGMDQDLPVEDIDQNEEQENFSYNTSADTKNLRGWWTDILQAAVGCWLNTIDELDNNDTATTDPQRQTNHSQQNPSQPTSRGVIIEEIDDEDENADLSPRPIRGNQKGKPSTEKDTQREQQLRNVQNECRLLVDALRRVVGSEKFGHVVELLVAEDGDLGDLFFKV